MIKEKIKIRGWVEILLTDVRTGRSRRYVGHNIVTNAGDLYYAQNAAREAPTTDFTAGGMRLGSAVTAPTKTDTDVTTFLAGSGKAVSAGYPKTNDVASAGGGVDKVTWSFYYPAGELTGVDIKEGAIVNNTTTPTSALSHFLFSTTINKSAGECLTVWLHHEFLGV